MATEFFSLIRAPVVPAEEQPRLPNNVKQHDADRLLKGIDHQFVIDCTGSLVEIDEAHVNITSIEC